MHFGVWAISKTKSKGVAMTKQDTYDLVVSHLRVQNKQALGKDGLCRYRGENGTKCAVGCLISDDEYSEALEGHSVGSDNAVGLNSLLERKGHDLDLLSKLQFIHDRTMPEDWEDKFRQLAEALALTYREAV